MFVCINFLEDDFFSVVVKVDKKFLVLWRWMEGKGVSRNEMGEKGL